MWYSILSAEVMMQQPTIVEVGKRACCFCKPDGKDLLATWR